MKFNSIMFNDSRPIAINSTEVLSQPPPKSVKEGFIYSRDSSVTMQSRRSGKSTIEEIVVASKYSRFAFGGYMNDDKGKKYIAAIIIRESQRQESETRSLSSYGE